MFWNGKQLTEEDVNDLFRLGFWASAVGPALLAYILHEICHLWDEIEPDPMLVAKQNVGKEILKRAAMVREDTIIELTRRLIESPPPAQLRGKET